MDAARGVMGAPGDPVVTCDVAVIGGGPAGSTCAWKLCQAGFDVAVIDGAVFPRDKACAGWITPRVVADLQLDADDYQRGRTFQAINGFRTGVIGRAATIFTGYDRPVSFGIRRTEFDHYLLNRSGARVLQGTPVTAFRREGATWVVNERVRTQMLVGAGGHFCPVARHLNPPVPVAAGVPLVAAQQAEWEPDAASAETRTVAGVPEIFFCEDLKGYGWAIRNGSYLNVGLGRVDRQSVPAAMRRFLEFLVRRGSIAAHRTARWRGHAYLLRAARHRHVVGDGVMLIGDAAGLADPHSGEGIGAAVRSALLAASTIVDARGRYTRGRLQPYADAIFAGVNENLMSRLRSVVAGSAPGLPLVRLLLQIPFFVRAVVLDRSFLGAGAPRGCTCPR